MSQIDENTKLYALAHLKNGKPPKEVSEMFKDISYAQALKLKKELNKAEHTNKLHTLFNMEEAALQTLLSKSQEELVDAVAVLEGDVEVAAEAVDRLSAGIQGMGILEKELQDAAVQVTKKIAIAAVTVTTAESLVTLADALAKLQNSFFAKGTNVQVNNINGSFEKYLSD